MSRRILLTAATVFHGALGIAALAVPMMTAAIFGLPLDPAAEPVVRLLGATLVGVAFAFWTARNAADQSLVQGILIAGLLINALSFGIVAFAITGGLMEPRTWITAIIRLLFAVGFAYHAFIGTRRTVSA
jgi:hypothetical protein